MTAFGRAKCRRICTFLLIATLTGRAGAFSLSPFSHFLRTSYLLQPPPRALQRMLHSGWRRTSDEEIWSVRPWGKGGAQLGMMGAQTTPRSKVQAREKEPTTPSLNKEQLAAVHAPIAPVIVLAGPGSGKTRVLTCRIGHMIESGYGYRTSPEPGPEPALSCGTGMLAQYRIHGGV